MRLSPVPPAFSDTSSSGDAVPGLELVDHPVAAGLGHATVQERRRQAEPLVEVALQQQAHLAELGEHQRLLAGVEQVGDQLVEAGQLARPAGEPRAVAERVRRVVADLLETGQRGQHQAAALHAGGLLGVGQQLVDDALVHAGLLAGERRPRDLLDLVGQVGHQRLVGLGAAQQERLM